jgi:LuxR family maltose regulon positive regulatory protein
VVSRDLAAPPSTQHAAEGSHAFPPPPPRAGVIARPRVTGLLDDAEVPVAVVCAPAGSGKTTLLTQWALAFDGPLAWIDVNEAYNDPAVLVPDLLAALGAVAPEILGDLLELSPGPDTPISTRVLPRLARVLRTVTRPFALVVDDVHLLTEPAATEPIEVVAQNLPPGCRLVLGTRFAPALRVASLVARRVAVEIGPRDLAVRPEEAPALLAAAGLPVDGTAARTLADRTEGWAAGMILGAMAVRRADDQEAAARAFGGGERQVTAFFGQEVLAGLTASDTRLLEATAILGDATAAGCSAVLGREVSVTELRALAASHSFLAPVDEDGGHFRLHALFGEMLRAEMHGRDRGAAEAMHLRAAAWHMARGDHLAGVRHLIAGGEPGGAATAVWRLVPPLQTRGRVATLRRMIGLFDPDEVAARPPLAVAAAWAATEGGSQMVRHWMRVAETGLARTPVAPETPEIRANLLLLRATACLDGARQMLEDARAACAAYPDDSPWRAPALLFEGMAHHLLDEPGPGDRALAECVERAGVALPTVAMLGCSCTAIVALLGDRTAAADRAVGPALALVDDHGLRDYSTTYLLDAVLAVRAAQGGDAPAARGRILSAREKLPRIQEVAPWGAVLSRVLLARAAMRIGDDAVARTVAAETAAHHARITDSPLLDRVCTELMGALDGVPAGAVTGLGSLTTAELRVLRFMPTHLTYKEMGERMHVSRFTVKSQAQAVYRKLGVTTRSDAVARARALGLLDV